MKPHPYPPAVRVTLRCQNCGSTVTCGRVSEVTLCGQCGGRMVVIMAARVDLA